MTRHAVITGGSSGIGLALARQLVVCGWNVSLIARNESLLRHASTELEDLRVRDDQRIHGCSCDVTLAAETDRAFGEVSGQLGAPALVLLSAGICEPGHFLEQDLSVHERTMQVNYLGSLYCAHAAARRMRGVAGGRIVFISSGAGLVGLFGYSSYSPGKFALRGLAEALHAELKPVGIGVSIAFPPDTDTPQLAKEKLTKPPETMAITESAGIWPADEVAKRILAGIGRGRFSIPVGLELGLLSRLHGLVAPLLRWHFERLANRARNRRAASK